MYRACATRSPDLRSPEEAMASWPFSALGLMPPKLATQHGSRIVMDPIHRRGSAASCLHLVHCWHADGATMSRTCGVVGREIPDGNNHPCRDQSQAPRVDSLPNSGTREKGAQQPDIQIEAESPPLAKQVTQLAGSICTWCTLRCGQTCHSRTRPRAGRDQKLSAAGPACPSSAHVLESRTKAQASRAL